MKKSYVALAVAAMGLGLLGTGCSSVNSSDSAKIVDIGTNAVRYDVVTSVQNHPVTGEASHSRLFGLLTWGDNDFADNATFTVSTSGSSALDTVAGAVSPVGFLSGIFGGSVYDEVKKAATYNACKANKAYDLAAARYEITTSNYLIYRRVSCTVTGFPVKVLGVKPATEKNK